jgi:hypothetical protein
MAYHDLLYLLGALAYVVVVVTMWRVRNHDALERHKHTTNL